MCASSRARDAVPSGETADRPAGAGSETVFHVQGMDCADCARRIQDRIGRLDGVVEAVGNPVSRNVRVAYDPRRLGAERIRTEIGKLGYTAREEEDGAPAGGGRTTLRAAPVWRGTQARRTGVSAGLLAAGILLRLAGLDAVLLSLPLAPLRLPDLLYVLAAAVGGWNFFPAGVRAARRLSLDMNFLMTAAILGAVVVGEYAEAGAIAFLFSLAELLERGAVDRARGSIEALLELAPDVAVVVRDGEEVTVPAGELAEGEVVVVRPGARVPADGTVLEGASDVNQAPITGESMPVARGPGDEVFAGTLNGAGWLRVRVERAGARTTFARIVRLVEEAEAKKAPSERFVERFARVYTPAVTVAAVLVMVGPPLLLEASFSTWFVRGLTLLVIACPCALVISTPVAVVSGITAAARAGVLIKGGVHLEAMGKVQTVAFDKTGTLTAGHPEVTDVLALDGASPEEVLSLAAALEARSAHPVATAIRRAAEERGLRGGWRVEAFESVHGLGVRARLDGIPCAVGAPQLLGFGGDGEGEVAALRRQGKTAVLVARAGRPLGAIAVADRPRPGAAEAIRRLKRAGVRRTVMLTGDNPETARAIAAEVGIDEVYAGLLPEQKVAKVRELERRDGPVAMVGDGVNDGPALAAATVGIAMGVAGSDVALETADVALMGDDLSRLAYLYRLSHAGRGVIRQNIAASLALKLGLAAGVPLGLVSLIVAVLVGDMGASLGVTANSLRLARIRG